jgi:putative spermidine/putrescine transport system permease protein
MNGKQNGAAVRPYLLTAPAALAFTAMVLVPLLAVFVLSFNGYEDGAGIQNTYMVGHYREVLTDSYFHGIFFRTLWMASLTTLICIFIGVPEAYVLARMKKPWNSIFLVVILGPLLISVVVRAFGWSMLLGPAGVVNAMLEGLGLPPVKILYTMWAVIIGLVHIMLPFMVIPVWTSLQRLDPAVEQAALSLNASETTVLRRIVLPQVLPGVLSGSLIVFGLSASYFAIPGLLGGRHLKVVATTIYDEFLVSLNWPLGAAIAVILLVANLLIMMGYNRILERRYSRTLG